MPRVEELASLVGGSVVGDGSLEVHRLAPLNEAGPTELSFLANPRYRDDLDNTRAGAVLMSRIEADRCQSGAPAAATTALIVCADPYLALAQIAKTLSPTSAPPAGVHPGAHVHPEAEVDASATICMGAVIDAGAHVGARTVIGATAVVDRGASVGNDCVLHAGAKVLTGCRVGHRVTLHAGVVIGGDGFGYAVDDKGRRHKIVQAGRVEIDDDVEIGANSTVDRGTFGATRIGRRTKIDNQVQVGHNVVIGEDCAIAALTGLAGSVRIGNRVVMGGQAATVGHITITDDVIIGARGAPSNDIDEPGVYSGAPAYDHKHWLKVKALQKQLPEMRRQLAALQRRMDALDPKESHSTRFARSGQA